MERTALSNDTATCSKKEKPHKKEKMVRTTSTRQMEIVNFHIAQNMIKRFGYRAWMSQSNVVGPNNERIVAGGKIVCNTKK